VKVTEEAASTGSASAHGVRQVWPLDAFASAPGGSDSKLTVSKEGPDLNASRLAQSELDEHAASASAPPAIARTRYIILTVPSSDLTTLARCKDTDLVIQVQHLTKLTIIPKLAG
jgi:hypothetical protein